MWWRLPRNPTPYDDDWEGQPAQGSFYQWGVGLGLPTVIAAYGLHGIFAHEITFGNQIRMTLHGSNAAAFGWAWIAAAVFIHYHYFWGNIYDQAWFAILGKIVSACAFIASLAYLLVQVAVMGRT